MSCLLALASSGMAGESLPEERVHEAPVTREKMPEGFQPLDETELSRTRGVINAPEPLSAPRTEEDSTHHENELVRHQRADEAALIVDLDSRIEDTARALRGAPDEQRPQLEQRYQNLTTLRQGF